MHRTVPALCALALAACSTDALTVAFDRAGLEAACGAKSPTAPIGGASDALWSACADRKVWQVWDGAAFRAAEIPGGVPAIGARVAGDRALWVTTRDPAVVTSTNARLLFRVGVDGQAEDRTSEVSQTREDSLELTGAGGVVVVRRGSALSLVDGAKITALPAPMVDIFRVLGVLPVLQAGNFTRFFLHLAVGAGSPGTPDDVKLFLWDGAAWTEAKLQDPSGWLRETGWPRLFVPLDGQFFGISTNVAPQDRVITCTFARWDGTTLSAQQFRLSVEVGYFGPQQLLVRQDGTLLLVGNETEGDTSVTTRLTGYRFTGEDFRRREDLHTIQSCEVGQCDRSASEPTLLSDGGVLYVVSWKDGFEALIGKP